MSRRGTKSSASIERWLTRSVVTRAGSFSRLFCLYVIDRERTYSLRPTLVSHLLSTESMKLEKIDEADSVLSAAALNHRQCGSIRRGTQQRDQQRRWNAVNDRPIRNARADDPHLLVRRCKRHIVRLPIC